MEERARFLQELMSNLTYAVGIIGISLSFIGHYAGVFLVFIGGYQAGFTVIFLGITCAVNWHYQRVRTRLAKAKADDGI